MAHAYTTTQAGMSFSHWSFNVAFPSLYMLNIGTLCPLFVCLQESSSGSELYACHWLVPQTYLEEGLRWWVPVGQSRKSAEILI